ncbi:hypothetical protein IMAU60055_03036 [Lactiplantibacillus plantarum]|nr:hypothetical protein [Lactiplantibacillus plantarum]
MELDNSIQQMITKDLVQKNDYFYGWTIEK